jgi:hypothetical protein
MRSFSMVWAFLRWFVVLLRGLGLCGLLVTAHIAELIRMASRQHRGDRNQDQKHFVDRSHLLLRQWFDTKSLSCT